MQATLPFGTVLQGRYVVENLLGKGGFGAVYLVRDQKVRGNRFALKEVIDQGEQDRKPFIQEGDLLKRLDHPALPRVYRVFEDSEHGRAYILMDYVEGSNLEILRKQQPGERFSLPQVLAIMAPIVDAVTYLHHQQPPIIHRDIKPANIIVPVEGGEAMLVDFGVAKEYDPASTTTAIRRATPGYAALEQYSSGTNTRTDIYGLGATFYTLLTGTVPIDALYRMTQLGSRGIDPLEPVNVLVPDIPATVAEAINHAMSLDGANRFSTVEQFWQALNAYPARGQQPGSIVSPLAPQRRLVIPPMEPASVPGISSVAPSRPPVPPRPGFANTPLPTQPAPQAPPRSEKQRGLLPCLLVALVLLVVLGTAAGFWFFSAGSPLTHTPSSASSHYPTVAGRYHGTIQNTTAGITTWMSLSIQQNQDQGNISGDFTVGPELEGSGSFTGTVDTAKHIQFTVHRYKKNAPLFFEGTVRADGSMQGTYCSLQGDHCSSQAGASGLWNVTPTPGQ